MPSTLPSDIASLLKDLAHPLEPVILAVRAHILASGSGITESIKWNAPSYATTEHFATFHLRSPSAVQVVLHLGAKARPDATVRQDIADPSRLLAWKSADRATVTFKSPADVQQHGAAFASIVRAWVTHVR